MGGVPGCEPDTTITDPCGNYCAAYPDNGILFEATKKEMSYQVMKRRGGSLNACY